MSEFYQSKSDFYKSLIKVHKESGQGLYGIVRIQSKLLGYYLDELIDEGLIKCCNLGGSIGHPESNKFYCPTKGYCVWDELDATKSLTFVRLYLNILPSDSNSMFDVTITDVIRNCELMKDYTEWLKENESSLKEMVELSDYYDTSSNNLLEKLLDNKILQKYIKKNLSVEQCIVKIVEDSKLINRKISIQKELLSLKRRANEIGRDYNISKDEDELNQLLSESNFYLQISEWFKSQNKSELIGNIIKKYKL